MIRQVNNLPVLNQSMRGNILRSFATKGRKGAGNTTEPSASCTIGDKKDTIEKNGFSAMIHPKLKLYGLHARYANALYSNASKLGNLPQVEKELKSMDELISSNDNFKQYLHNPTIPRSKKKENIVSFMTEGKFSEPVSGLFRVLAENGRLSESQKVISTFVSLMESHRGEVKAKVVSANPLTSQQLEQVKNALSKHIQKDENLVVQTDVNPQILGGLQVHIGTMFIDLSISNKINKLDKLLSSPVDL